MKKLIFSLLIFGGVAFLGTTAVNANELPQEKEQPAKVVGSGFTDVNGDGLCDNYNGTQPGKGQGPGNGQGLGKADGKGLGKGMGLKNGSGNGQRRLNGSGQGRNKGNGRQDGSRGRCQPSGK